MASSIIARSNFGGEGLRAVGGGGMSPFGTYDMAGNARGNAVGESNDRYILGGAWSDPSYKFVEMAALAPFDRSPLNGFRTVRYKNLEAIAGLQTVVFWPGANAISTASFENIPATFDYLIMSGRAVAFSVYDETFERNRGRVISYPDGTTSYRDWSIRTSNRHRTRRGREHELPSPQPSRVSLQTEIVENISTAMMVKDGTTCTDGKVTS